ncbi:MAG: hypothetical protein N2316_12940 [Spirochaetes bacterium]|nr:hypothetical protein [Spirochaetota bacterium]
MSLLTIHYRRMRTFVYLLIFLLIFNLIFNLYYTWYGISIIVRVYLFVFSFYLVYNYSSIDIERLKELYKRRFGRKSDLFVLFEMGIAPLLVIYGITIVFTLIDYLRLPNWPWNPILSLLNGRYSNIVIYSLLLFIILKTKFNPTFKILLFFGSSIIYFIADKYLGIIFPHGLGLVVVKFSKLLVIFYCLFYGLLGSEGKKWSLVHASAIAGLIVGMIVTSYYIIFRFSPIDSYRHIVAGLTLMRYGFSFPISDVGKSIVEYHEYSFVREYIDVLVSQKKEVPFSPAHWENLVTSGTIEQVNFVAGILVEKQIPLSFEKLIHSVKEKTKDPAADFTLASNYISLVAKNAGGKTEILLKMMNDADNKNENFIIFGISVLGEIKDAKAIPLLIDYLTGINFKISIAAYDALKKITGQDPADENNIQRNDPLSIATFYEYYKKNRKAN